MGFPEEDVIKALKATGNNQRAAVSLSLFVRFSPAYNSFIKGIWQQKIFLAHLKELLKSFSKLFYSFYISRLFFEIL